LTTISQEPSGVRAERRTWSKRLLVPEMWASLAISVMWLAVLFDALFGPDIVSNNATSTTRVPSAVVVALFAYLATRVTARYGFGLPRRDTVDQEHRNARNGSAS
jgi:hypothetical protein